VNTSSAPFELTLAHKALFSVSDVAGVQILCRSGSLWITLDHDIRDIVLEAGESFLSTEHRKAIIYAMEQSSLTLSAQKTLQGPRAGAKPAVAPPQVSFALHAAIGG
jgi:hypothetical protein